MQSNVAHNQDMLKDFIRDNHLDVTIEQVLDDQPNCILCARCTYFLGVYEAEEDFKFYGLCSRHYRHIGNLQQRIIDKLEEPAIPLNTATAVFETDKCDLKV